MPPTKGRWTTNPRDIQVKQTPEGRLTTRVPLIDNGRLQGFLAIDITEDRVMTIVWDEEPSAEKLTGFQAWWKES